MLIELTPRAANARFMALDDVRDAGSSQSVLVS